jgi:hypothetical protein
MRFGNVARVIAVCAACLAAVGSATSNSNPPAVQPQASNMSPPPPREMEPARALGLWRSTFGAVKIEADNSRGGVQAGAIQGVWVYQRQGQEVVGYFSGSLRGNVLQFRWQEPNNPPLTGEGYLVFDQTGRQYSGRWWSDKRDRVGDWNGWRQASASQQPAPQYGGQPYGGQNPYMGSQYGGQTYGRPQQPQQPQQYPGQYPAQYPQQQPQQPTQPYYPQQPPPQQQNPYGPQQPQYPQQQPTQPYYPQQPAPQPQQPYYPPR